MSPTNALLKGSAVAVGDKLRTPKGALVTVVAVYNDGNCSVQLRYQNGRHRWVWERDARKMERVR